MNTITVNPQDGAVIPGGLDFAPVLSRRIADLPEHTTVVFSPGEYHFWPEKAPERTLYISNTDSSQYPSKRVGLLLEHKKSLTFRGDARLIFHGNLMMLGLIDCSDIRVEGLRMDYDCPSVIDATVVEWDGRTALVRYPAVYGCDVSDTVVWKSEESPYTGQSYWSGEKGLDLSQHLRKGKVSRTDRDLFCGCVGASRTEEGLLALTYGEGRDIEAGDVFQMRLTHRDSSGIHLDRCDNIHFSNMHIGFLYSMGIVSQCSRNLSFQDMDFLPPGDGRHSSSAADILHFSGCGGQIRIQRCRFVNPHDDPINVHGTYLQVADCHDKALDLVYRHHQTMGFPPIFPGDLLRFYRVDTMLPVSGDFVAVEVDGPDSGDLTAVRVTLDQVPALPAGCGLVVENRSYLADVTVEDCIFEQVPTRGLLVSTGGKVRIRRNRFERIHMAGILISSDAVQWYESGPVEDVVIEENCFEDCEGPALQVEPTNTADGGIAVHSGISFVRNQLLHMPFPVFSIKSAAVSVKGNRIDRKGQGDAELLESMSSDVKWSHNQLV